MVLLSLADTVIGILNFKKYVFSRNFAFATGSFQDASANIGSVAMKLLLSRQGFFLKLRHWPPGTDNLPFVPPFFVFWTVISITSSIVAIAILSPNPCGRATLSF